MEPKSELMVGRTYEKSGELKSLYARELTGTDGIGPLFRLETHLNYVEDVDARVESTNFFYMRRLYMSKLLDLLECGWQKKKTKAGVSSNQHTRDFDFTSL